LPGCARQVREPSTPVGIKPGFSTGLLSWRKGIDIPVDSPAGLSTSAHRRTGEWEKQIGFPANQIEPRIVSNGARSRALCGRFQRSIG